MKDTIRTVLAEQARLPVPVEQLADNDDLYVAGMTSHASVSVMLGLEDAFDLEFPDQLLTRAAFASVNSIAAAVGQLAPGTTS